MGDGDGGGFVMGGGDLKKLLKMLAGPELGDEEEPKFFPFYVEIVDGELFRLVREKQKLSTEAMELIRRLELLKAETELIHKKVYRRIEELHPNSIRFETRKYEDNDLDERGTIKVYGWNESDEAEYRRIKRALS